MFSGIIAAVGKVQEIAPRTSGVRLTVHAGGLDLSDVILGDSIACNGICLTVVDLLPAAEPTAFVVDVSDETLRCTTGLMADAPLNLEKALRLADRLGGHLVTGHVDGVATIVERRDFDGMAHFDIEAPAAVARFIAEKGSVCLDGTSLTVNSVSGNRFTILLIPHTLEVTTWGERKTGDRLNIEVDLMARYAARLVEAK